ncbi:uncharacterized protein TM35_000051720 [Trypanosoma theileri]|uniref:Uncharacterized protein n=1 Tax=Trypanosoma theileri TaxID=67003 RepID=A0A1X0P3T0_9TRYP|nr:uncharacterized protein TM35_000051720 [Trypanosoma theileri]ORC91576.1 hypothetical protein TM35_000051720 [Trypanosoma theileri]
MTDTTALPMRSTASCLQGFTEHRSIVVGPNRSRSRSSSITNGNTSNINNNYSNNNNNNNNNIHNNNNDNNTGMGLMGTTESRSFRVRVAQSATTNSNNNNNNNRPFNTPTKQPSRGLLEETDVLNYRRGGSIPHELQEPRIDGEDSSYARVRQSLETTLRDREKELAAALQREKTLISRLRVSEETRVLYQLYTQRLLELLRVQEWSHPLPFVKNSEVIDALREAIHSGEIVMMSEDSTHTQESNTDGTISTSMLTSSPSTPASSIQLTNATLLTSAMLESKVTNCLLHLKREKVRRQESMMQTLQTASNTFVEEMEAKLAVLSSALRQVEQRVGEHVATTTVTLQRHVRNTQNNGLCIEQQQEELRRLKQECVRYQREQQRTQGEMTALKDELARLDGDREAALIMHRAAECLEDVRQSVRNAVRGAAHSIEQSTLESNTLKEPFIQSMRVIAVKVEAHADMARTAVRRWQQEYHINNNNNNNNNNNINNNINYNNNNVREAFRTDVDMDAVHRLLLSPPRRVTRSCEQSSLLPRDDNVGNSNLMMLEELARVMKNLCRLLENNARQMETNTAKVTKSIADWEKAIVKQMTDIWECMRAGLLEHGVIPPTSTQHRQLCGEAPLALGDHHYTDGSTTAASTHIHHINSSSNSHSDNNTSTNININHNQHHNSSNSNNNNNTNRGSVLPLSQTNYTNNTTTTTTTTTVAAPPSKVIMGRNGSISTSCGHTHSMSGVPSYSSSTNASRATSAMTSSAAPSWNLPSAVLCEVERTPDSRSHRDKDFLSPPSINVSRAPTPPPPSFQSQGLRTATNLFQHQQQDRIVDISPCKIPSSGNGLSTVPRLHYTREIENLESNSARSVSGAILPRRTQTFS